MLLHIIMLHNHQLLHTQGIIVLLSLLNYYCTITIDYGIIQVVFKMTF